jgi:hypothetical protein
MVNGMEQGDVLSSLHFNSDLEFGIKEVWVKLKQR